MGSLRLLGLALAGGLLGCCPLLQCYTHSSRWSAGKHNETSPCFPPVLRGRCLQAVLQGFTGGLYQVGLGGWVKSWVWGWFVKCEVRGDGSKAGWGWFVRCGGVAGGQKVGVQGLVSKSGN